MRVTKKPIPGVPLSKGKVAPIPQNLSLDDRGKSAEAVSTKQKPPADPTQIKNQILKKIPIEKLNIKIPSALTEKELPGKTPLETTQDKTINYEEQVKAIELVFQSDSGKLPANQTTVVKKDPMGITQERPSPVEEITPGKGHFTVKVPISNNKTEGTMDSGNFTISSGELNVTIPDGGYYWIGMATADVLPSN